MLSMSSNPMSIFTHKPDAPNVSFFNSLKKDDYPYSPDSEGFTLNGKFEPSNNRLNYFLSCGETAIFPFIDNYGKVDVNSFAESCGYKIFKQDNLNNELEKLSRMEKYESDFKNGVPEKEIDGFSIRSEKEIYVNKSADNEKIVFAIIHELSHGLLCHNREIFCKISNHDDYNKASIEFEGEAYNEEADRLAAILLMPHFMMINKLEHPSSELAKQFGVSVIAVDKRKKEVEKEASVLGYVPIMNESDLRD